MTPGHIFTYFAEVDEHGRLVSEAYNGNGLTDEEARVMKKDDEVRIIGPATSAFLGEEGTVLRVRNDGALLWRPHLWGGESMWIDPRCVELVEKREDGDGGG